LNSFQAAERAGLNRSYVYEILRGKKSNPRNAPLEALARVLHCRPEYLRGQVDTPDGEAASRAQVDTGLPLAGSCARDVWQTVKTGQRAFLPVAPDPRYPIEDQKAYSVRDQHAEWLGIVEGSILVVVSGLDPRPHDVVVVRRERRGAFELSVRRVEGENLVARSPGTPPSTIKRDAAKVIGIVLRAVRIFGFDN
jgi:transcriptional regulator with XRE-family HTH domain